MSKNEYIGYRSNREPIGAIDSKIITVFAERNNNRSLGEYGGDGYPFTYEINKDGKIYGISVAADGVGNGGYTHPSLEKNLNEYILANYPGLLEKERDATMLYAFLTILYGESFIKDEEALDYALKSFGYVPTDGFFAEDKDCWHTFSCENNPATDRHGQAVIPFWYRDSQSLGSRIVCVGLYYKFRKYLVNNHNNCIDKQFANTLRTDIENYLSVLSVNISKLFDHSDAPNTIKRNHYFLCSTLAVWFYISDGKNVSALSLNCGDARCYIIDTKEGVRQISVDDAFADGTMSAFIHYGEKQRNDELYHDGKLHARIVNLQYPCALFVCSDGIYDTCPSEKGIYVATENEEPNANDFLFEFNMLKALRNCYSLEDFRREVVFNFYAQADTCCSELRKSGNYSHVKKDDSGTLSGRIFASSAVELFDALRKNEVFLDRLLSLLYTEKEKGVLIPYYPPKASSSDEKQTEFFGDYAQDTFKSAVIDILRPSYPEVFNAMKASGESTLWGIENCNDFLGGFKLNKLLLARSNLEIMLKGAIDAYRSMPEESEIKSNLWDNVLCLKGVKEALETTSPSISEFISQYDELSQKGSDDDTIELYTRFERCFMGNRANGYDVDIVKDRTLESLQQNS